MKRGGQNNRVKAVDDVSFSVSSGEIVGFLGPNGAGKSTTIKMIVGLAAPTSGRIFIMGHDVAAEREKALAVVGGVIESPDMYLEMTAMQNLMYFASLHPLSTLADENDPNFIGKSRSEIEKARCEDLLRVVGLYARKDDKVRKFSMGMKQRLGIAQSLLSRPKLLILDEPTNGLDPAGIKEVRDMLRSLTAMDMAVLVSSHQLAEMQLMCDRAIIIVQGKITADKHIDELNVGDKGEKSFIVKVDRASDAAAMLAEKFGLSATAENGIVRFVASADISEITRELVLAGFNISGLREEQIRLEEVFLTATGASEDNFKKGGDSNEDK